MKLLARLLALGAGAAAAWVLARELIEDAESGAAPSGYGQGSASPTGADFGEGSDGGGTSRSGLTQTQAAQPSGSNGADPSELSKAELYEEAKRLEIEGRSKMSKEELARAISRARG